MSHTTDEAPQTVLTIAAPRYVNLLLKTFDCLQEAYCDLIEKRAQVARHAIAGSSFTYADTIQYTLGKMETRIWAYREQCRVLVSLLNPQASDLADKLEYIARDLEIAAHHFDQYGTDTTHTANRKTMMRRLASREWTEQARSVLSVLDDQSE